MDTNDEAMNSETVQEAVTDEATVEKTPAVEPEEQQSARIDASSASLDRSDASESKTGGRPASGKKRVLIGRVVSDRMQKTIVVQIERRTLHPLYKKYITRTKRIKAHDETNQCQTGDLVRVVESRPISKDKRWRLAEILEKAK